MGKTPQVRVIFYHLYFFLLVPLSVLHILWSYNIYLKQIKMSYFYLFSQLMHWRLSWLKWTGWILWLCWKGPYLTMVTFQAPEVLQMIALCARKRRMVKFSPIWTPPPPPPPSLPLQLIPFLLSPLFFPLQPPCAVCQSVYYRWATNNYYFWTFWMLKSQWDI